MKLFQKLFSLVAEIKVYFSSAGVYLSIINFILLLATFKLTYGVEISVFILAPLGFLFVLFIGYLDYKLILHHQSKHVNKKNDLKAQLTRVEEKLDKLLKEEH